MKKNRKSAVRKSPRKVKPRRYDPIYDDWPAINPGIRAVRDESVPVEPPTLKEVLATKPQTERVLRTISYPTTWWDALKLRFYPIWALTRWPADYTSVQYWEDMPVAATVTTTTTTTGAGAPVTITYGGNVMVGGTTTVASETTTAAAGSTAIYTKPLRMPPGSRVTKA